uniref:(northern house mosquito) hypothetical protein n=1 Tax=Culex pipiens TaxID=7175 RepID=A0A8D8FF58_CULPI
MAVMDSIQLAPPTARSTSTPRATTTPPCRGSSDWALCTTRCWARSSPCWPGPSSATRPAASRNPSRTDCSRRGFAPGTNPSAASTTTSTNNPRSRCRCCSGSKIRPKFTNNNDNDECMEFFFVLYL